MKNVLTVDVEDWRQLVYWKVTGKGMAPDPLAARETRDLLGHLEAHGIKATMFVLDNMVREFPDLVREMDRAGHEIGSHGLSHRLIYHQTPEEFRRETREAKDRIEQVIGKPVKGYRAAEFSITRDSWWALEILAEAGFEYDSSVFPISGARYGVPDFPIFPTRVNTSAGNLVEIPLTVWAWSGRRFPVAGGGYLRVLPYFLTKAALESVNRSNRAGVVYLHPYEFTQEPLRLPPGVWESSSLPLFIRYGLFHNLSRHLMRNRVLRLLHDFGWLPCREVLSHVQGN